jgi:hypothetical protein
VPSLVAMQYNPDHYQVLGFSFVPISTKCLSYPEKKVFLRTHGCLCRLVPAVTISESLYTDIAGKINTYSIEYFIHAQKLTIDSG